MLSSKAPAIPKGTGPLILLDPGHGSNDSGAVDPGGVREDDLNLAAALTLKYQLETLWGVRVLLTRTGDTRPTYAERVNDHGAGSVLMVSVHHDTAAASQSGVFYNRRDDAKRLAQEVAAALDAANGAPGVWVRSSYERVWDKGARGLYIDDYRGPAILIEVGPVHTYSVQDRLRYMTAAAAPIARAARAYANA